MICKKDEVWNKLERAIKLSSDFRDMLNNQTTKGKLKKTASPDILCRIEESPIIGRLIVSKFRFTGRLSFSITYQFKNLLFGRLKAWSL